MRKLHQRKKPTRQILSVSSGAKTVSNISRKICIQSRMKNIYKSESREISEQMKLHLTASGITLQNLKSIEQFQNDEINHNSYPLQTHERMD